MKFQRLKEADLYHTMKTVRNAMWVEMNGKHLSTKKRFPNWEKINIY